MEDRGVGEAIAGLSAVEVRGATGRVDGRRELAQRVRGWVDAVDVAIARCHASLPPRVVRSRRPRCCRGTGGVRPRTKAASDRSEVCEADARLRSGDGDRDVSSGHVDAVANAAKGLDDAGRDVWASCKTLVELRWSSRCRGSSDAAGCSPNDWPATKAKRVGQAESGGVGTALGRQTRPACTTPTSPSIRTRRQTVVSDRHPTGDR